MAARPLRRLRRGYNARPLRYPEATFLMPFTLSVPCELLEVISKSRFLAKAAPVQSRKKRRHSSGGQRSDRYA